MTLAKVLYLKADMYMSSKKPQKFIKYTSKRNNLMTYNIIIWNRRNEDYKQFLFLMIADK